MPPASQPLRGLTIADVMQDLETGRSLPPRRTDRLANLTSLSRPTLGGRTFRWTHLSAKALGAIHPRLARRSLMRLWFTPWVHPSALRPIEDLSHDFSAWSLPTTGATLRGYTAGDGPTVVLVHGWAGRAADWRHLAADLSAAGWRVVAPDLPAHGMTAGDRTDLFQLGRALAAVLDRERPAAVVTHSMGFPATMLAIEDGAPQPATLVALAPGRKIARAVDGFAQRAGLRPTLKSELHRGLEARFGPEVWEILDVDRVLPQLDSTGLVIHDGDDDEVPPMDAEYIAGAWRGAELSTTHGLGHRRLLRDETVRDSVVGWLSSRPSSRLAPHQLQPSPLGPS